MPRYSVEDGTMSLVSRVFHEQDKLKKAIPRVQWVDTDTGEGERLAGSSETNDLRTISLTGLAVLLNPV